MPCWFVSLAALAAGPLDTPPPLPPTTVERVKIAPDDLAALRRYGERVFREAGWGSERSVTDVMGALMGTVTVPCPESTSGCARPVLPLVAAAIDALDGVSGNLFDGNGGGYTSNLGVRFPPGTTVHGVPVPETVWTGLDVDAGAAFPVGLTPVPAPEAERHLPWLIDPETLGVGPVPDALKGARLRVRLGCAACHYTLDVDHDGVADLRSTQADQPTPGSPYGPEHGWSAGNQDLSFGWLFALSKNVLLGAFVLSGWLEDPSPDAPSRFGEWVRDQYDEDPAKVRHDVVAGMLAQPRNFADVSSDALYDPIQIPPLYPREGWPFNSNGAQFHADDRDNTVWTGALDFTGQIALTSDRQGRTATKRGDKPFARFTADELATMWLSEAPAAADDAWRERLHADMVGDDGAPGLLDVNQLVAIKPGFPFFPMTVDQWMEAPHRRRIGELPPHVRKRGRAIAPLGSRLGRPNDTGDFALDAFLKEYPGLYGDDIAHLATTAWLDTLSPPPNRSPWLVADLVQRGADVFVASGCASCHEGPFGVDHRIHPVTDHDDAVQWGRALMPSTAGWRVPGRGLPEPVYTEHRRASGSRDLRAVVSSPYNVATGQPSLRGGVLWALVANQHIGYRTTSLRGLWTSAPYLHDGGVSVGLLTRVDDASLEARLRRAAGPDVVYGTAQNLLRWDADPTATRADAALSLQALVIESERQRLLDANASPAWPAPSGALVPMSRLHITGEGHPYWVDDEPGGPDVTALVAFLLAWDDCPADVVGQTCPTASGYGSAPW